MLAVGFALGEEAETLLNAFCRCVLLCGDPWGGCLFGKSCSGAEGGRAGVHAVVESMSPVLLAPPFSSPEFPPVPAC